MLCPDCQQDLERVNIPSYLGTVYHCEECNRDWWYQQIVNKCPECGHLDYQGYRLTKKKTLYVSELCKNCEV
jgi:rubrerythrin